MRIGNLSICILFVFLTQDAFADAVIDEARELLSRNQTEAAFALLDPLEAERSGDPEFDYLLGFTALDTGHPMGAVFALERVLAVEPTHDLARAEIARAYFIMGERATARKEFKTVRESAAAPAEALQTIDKYIDLLERAQPPTALGTTISGYVDVALGYDSNINSATDESLLALPLLGGVQFQLSDNAVENCHGFAKVAGGVDVSHAFTERWQVIGGARFQSAHQSTVQHP